MFTLGFNKTSADLQALSKGVNGGQQTTFSQGVQNVKNFFTPKPKPPAVKLDNITGAPASTFR